MSTLTVSLIFFSCLCFSPAHMKQRRGGPRQHRPVGEGCEDELFYLDEELDFQTANIRCMELRYDGLAALLTEDEKGRANNLVKNESSTPRNVWIGLQYNDLNSSWIWNRYGEWEPYSLDPRAPTDGWRDSPITKPCVGINYTLSHHGPAFRWRSQDCTTLNVALCQREQIFERGKMVLINKSSQSNTIATNVRSFLECSILCTSSCTCKYIHYVDGACRLMKELDMSGGVNGVLYKKVKIYDHS